TILRPLNCLMSMIAVFIGGLLVADIQTLLYTSPIYVAMFAAFVITGSGNVINDFVDVESDKVNARNRPIVAGKLSRNSVFVYSVILFVAGVISTLLINNLYLLAIALVNSILLVIYSYHLQNKVLLGNLVVSYLVGSTFLFGGVVFGNMLLPLLLMLLAMMSNVAREIVKDLEDLEGDRKSFLKRVVTKVKKAAERFDVVGGKAKLKYEKKISIAAQTSLLLAIAISPVPYLIGLLGLSYVILVIITDLIFIYCIYLMAKASKTEHYTRISKRIKIGMFFGLLAFVVGILI
ncbi:MAG: UbiA family prenyltransferase, partial [Nanoarchaeota archaeon]|nr:UbiA family prenyltransferase [Nanoarchaeota archaeon]